MAVRSNQPLVMREFRTAARARWVAGEARATQGRVPKMNAIYKTPHATLCDHLQVVAFMSQNEADP